MRIAVRSAEMAAPKILVAALIAAVLCFGSTSANSTPASVKTPAATLRLLEARVAATSADGRFMLSEARAQMMQAPTTPDGRFSLIETRRPEVGCDPFPEQLFANGFE
jgi:hypothetical protein